MTIAQPRMDRMVASVEHVFGWFTGGDWEQHHLDPGIADFTFGNPQELPLPGLVDALQRNAVPKDKDWFAYKISEEEPRTRRRRLAPRARPASPSSPRTSHDRRRVRRRSASRSGRSSTTGDEVIFLSPPWFFYELMIASAGATAGAGAARAARLRSRSPRRSPRPSRRGPGPIIVNSPHNPTGRIYREPELRGARRGPARGLRTQRPPDRACCRTSRTTGSSSTASSSARPALDYDPTITIYTYGKTLLAPGQRIGYVALPPDFPDREALGYRLFVQQLAAGWGFPNALLQHAISDLEALSIDIAALQARRDRLVPALREMGYEVTEPEGTFYLMARSPDPDDFAFATRLAELGALVLPGTIVEMPGWFRISLTASDDMVETGLRIFRETRLSA